MLSEISREFFEDVQEIRTLDNEYTEITIDSVYKFIVLLKQMTKRIFGELFPTSIGTQPSTGEVTLNKTCINC